MKQYLALTPQTLSRANAKGGAARLTPLLRRQMEVGKQRGMGPSL
jgi:hypothetical protein